MKTDITLYHYIFDEETQTEKYEKSYFYNVSWDGGKGASINKGYTEANDITIRIFHKDNLNLKESNFSIGDFFVAGICNKEITMKSELKDTYNITTIIPRIRGSIATNHIQIGAK
jgi:hypothetical protein